MTVTGNGSTWRNSGSVYVGGQAAIDGGNGTLSITNQGLVDIDGTLKLWPGGNVELDGGTLKAASLEFAGGSFNWTSGTLHLTGSNSTVDAEGPLGSSVTIGPTQTLIADVVDGWHSIGASGTGSMTINGGAANLSGDRVTIGVANGSEGTLNVAGGGQLYTQAVYVGYDNGSAGEVNIAGSNSDWTNPGELYVGYDGDAALNITDGGHVTSSYSTYIGLNPTSNGQVTIDGATSSWTQEWVIAIGSVGRATVTITGGGQFVTQRGAYIGDNVGGNGEVNVDGSTWTNYEELFVGRYGEGTLNVINGGQVESGPDPVRIGYYSGSTGDVLVQGATSKLSAFGGIHIVSLGLGGTGLLTVENGGSVEAPNVRIGPRGKLQGEGNIDADVLNFGLVAPGHLFRYAQYRRHVHAIHPGRTSYRTGAQ